MLGDYNDKLRNMTFEEIIKEIVSDNLNQMEGISVYGTDIPSQILYEDSLNKAMFIYTQDNEDFIFDHKDEAFRAVDYASSLGVTLSPFNRPEEYAYYMEQMGVVELLSTSKTIQENLDKEIVVDKETITKIKEELDIKEEKITMEDNKDLKKRRSY